MSLNRKDLARPAASKQGPPKRIKDGDRRRRGSDNAKQVQKAKELLRGLAEQEDDSTDE